MNDTKRTPYMDCFKAGYRRVIESDDGADIVCEISGIIVGCFAKLLINGLANYGARSMLNEGGRQRLAGSIE